MSSTNRIQIKYILQDTASNWISLNPMYPSGVIAYEYETNKIKLFDGNHTYNELPYLNESGGSGGTSDYNNLYNKPSINLVELVGNKTLDELGIQPKGEYVTISNVYTKDEIDSMVSSVYKFKGSVESFENLPKSRNKIGDVWNVIDTGANYAWDGKSWDKLSETYDLSNYALKSDLTSNNIEYNNGDITSVKEALDKLLYIDPKITSFTGGGTFEMGQTVESILLKWSINKDIESQSLNQNIGTIDKAIKQYQYNNPITSNTTFTLTINDGVKTANSSTTVSFKQKRYWGVSTKDNLSNEDILLLSQEFASNRQQTRTFDCSGGKYFYFIIPTQMCNGISFKVGGLAFSDMLNSTIQLINNYDYTSSYNVYRVNNVQTGSSIEVQVL